MGVEQMSETRQMKNILIVDDTVENIEILNGVLKNDYTIQATLSGAEALALVEKRAPDLILLDVMMPDMDGFEVCKRLKQNPMLKDIPVIFITALTDVFNEEHGFEVGAVDYITKPAKPAIVKARVATHLKLLEQKRQLEDKNRKLEQMQRVLVNKLARVCIPQFKELVPPPVIQAEQETKSENEYFLDDHKNDLLEILENVDSTVNLMILKHRFDEQACSDMRKLLYRFGTILNTYPSFINLGETILEFSNVFIDLEEYDDESKLTYVFEILESFSFTLGRWATQIFEMKTDNPNIFDNSIISDIKTIEMVLGNKDDEIESQIDFF